MLTALLEHGEVRIERRDDRYVVLLMFGDSHTGQWSAAVHHSSSGDLLLVGTQPAGRHGHHRAVQLRQ
jgi:hypothetical protein